MGCGAGLPESRAGSMASQPCALGQVVFASSVLSFSINKARKITSCRSGCCGGLSDFIPAKHLAQSQGPRTTPCTASCCYCFKNTGLKTSVGLRPPPGCKMRAGPKRPWLCSRLVPACCVKRLTWACFSGLRTARFSLRVRLRTWEVKSCWSRRGNLLLTGQSSRCLR